MAFTPEEEARLRAIIEAFANGKRLDELPIVTGDLSNLVFEVLENGVCKQARIADIPSRARGMFGSVSLLIAAIPYPQLGDWAYVGNSLPAAIYWCESEGYWSPTGQTGGGDVDLTEYTTSVEVTNIIDIL